MYIYFDSSFFIFADFKWELMVSCSTSRPAAKKKSFTNTEGKELPSTPTHGTSCFTQAPQNHQRPQWSGPR